MDYVSKINNERDMRCGASDKPVHFKKGGDLWGLSRTLSTITYSRIICIANRTEEWLMLVF